MNSAPPRKSDAQVSAPTPSPQYRSRLRAQLVASFDANEFKVLCADIGMNYDTVPGDELESRAHGLILKLSRHGELSRLTDHCARVRPHLDWRELAEERAQALDLAWLDDSDIPPPPKPDQPPQITAFVGRADALAHYATQLEQQHLALICGFAGVGKTTLAAVLAQRVANTPNNIFWHTFHADEGIEVILWKLAGFLAWQGQAELWRMLQSAQQGTGPSQPPHVMLDYLMPALITRDIVLCLDDYHWVADDPIAAQFVQRLRGALRASHLSLIITSREIPTFAEGEQSGPLSGLSVEDLKQWLAQRGLVLSTELVDELHARTEGNAQFLALAMNSLQRTATPNRFIAKLAEATDIERYLLHEVDHNLSEDERAAMGAVAVLLGYPGTRDALDAVLNGNLSRRTLNDLRERFLLLTTEGAAGKEYVQHAIVQAHYYDQFSKRERQAMHLRAAQFYATEEVDALKASLHFEQAGDVLRSAQWATNHLSVLINQGHARTVQKLLDRLPTPTLDEASRARVHEGRGDLEFLFGEFEAALRQYTSALQSADPTEAIFPARLQRKKGEVLYRQSAFDQSLAAFEHGRTLLLDQTDANLEMGQLAVGYGSTLLAMGRYDDALAEAWRGLVHLPDVSSQSSLRVSIEANLCDLIGKVAFYKGDFVESLAQFETALRLRQDIVDLRGVVRSYSNVAVVFGQQNRIEEAMNANRAALEIAERIGDTLALGMLYNNMASDFVDQHAFEKASELHLRALRLHEKMNNLEGKCLAYQNLGHVAQLQGRQREAIDNLSQALTIALEIGAPDLVVTVTTTLAESYLLLDQYEDALSKGLEALQRAETIQNLSFQPTCLDLLGRIYQALNRWQESRQCFAKAVELEQAQATFHDLATTYLHWAQTEQAAGNLDAARRLYDQATQVATEHQLTDLQLRIQNTPISSQA